MWNKIFTDNNEWVNYSSQHYWSFGIFALLGILFIIYVKKGLDKDQQHKALLYFCIFIWVVQYLKVLIRFYLGIFNYKVDLPLELCNMIPVFMTFAVYNRSRKWWGILFFWVMAGTFQSTITTTLADSFPHYEYLRYWIIHMGLTVAILYGVFVLGYRANLKDAWRAFIWLNIVGWSMYLVNMLLGSNYMYMQGKPKGETLYNVLGEWPIYLLQMQGMIWVFFIILLVPFWLINWLSKNKESQ